MGLPSARNLTELDRADLRLLHAEQASRICRILIMPICSVLAIGIQPQAVVPGWVVWVGAIALGIWLGWELEQEVKRATADRDRLQQAYNEAWEREQRREYGG